MFRRPFGRRKRANLAITEALYGRIVAAARQPAFYSLWGVPDTPLGRFEMLAIHVFLFLHRVRGEAPPLPDIAQVVTDVFFADVEDALRAFGIGDLGVPRRMKKLARMFYGRAKAYGAALDAGDCAALAAALRRNVRPDAGDWGGAEPLARYMMDAHATLQAQHPADLAAGRLHFPPAIPT